MQETEMPMFMMAKPTKPTKTPTKIQYTIKLMYRQQTTHSTSLFSVINNSNTIHGLPAITLVFARWLIFNWKQAPQ